MSYEAKDRHAATTTTTSTLRAGDVVRHRPSGETWHLAYGTPEGDVAACGWPESRAAARDCDLIEACSDAQHEAALRQWADPSRKRNDGRHDHRSVVCARQLAALLRATGRAAAEPALARVVVPDPARIALAEQPALRALEAAARRLLDAAGPPHDAPGYAEALAALNDLTAARDRMLYCPGCLATRVTPHPISVERVAPTGLCLGCGGAVEPLP